MIITAAALDAATKAYAKDSAYAYADRQLADMPEFREIADAIARDNGFADWPAMERETTARVIDMAAIRAQSNADAIRAYLAGGGSVAHTAANMAQRGANENMILHACYGVAMHTVPTMADSEVENIVIDAIKKARQQWAK